MSRISSVAGDRPGSGTAEDRGSWRSVLRRHWPKVVGVLGVTLAAVLLYRTLSGYSLEELVSAVAGIPATRLAAAAGFAAASYACLTLFDYFGLRYAGRPLAYPRAALASFTSLSLGHNIGFAALSSGAIRYRFYSRWGLDAEEVAKVVLFCAVTVGLGMMGVAGAALMLHPEMAADLIGVARPTAVGAGAAGLALVAAYVAVAALVRRPLRIRHWEFRLPPASLAIAQVVIGTANFACVAACLHQVVAAAAQTSYFAVASAYIIANTAALMAHVPGGLGVIETVVLHLLAGSALIGSVLAFRLVYYLAPLCLGILCLGLSELVLRRHGPPAG